MSAMQCPECGGDTRRLHSKSIVTGKRVNRQCRTCGYAFITLDQGEGEKFFRADTVKLTEVTDQQRRAFDLLCRALSTHPEAVFRPHIVSDLERCRIATKVRGRTAQSYFDEAKC